MRCSKVAIISDVHANFNALSSLKEYIDRESIDMVLNLGDFISNGPHPCQVFDEIINDKRFISIRGYDEESIFNSIKAVEGIGQGEWLSEKLGEQRVKKLGKLASMNTLSINGMKILMCHHSGWADIEQKNAHEHKFRSKAYDFILRGGSHFQELSHSYRNYANTNIIDPGSLGIGKGGKGYFATIDFSCGEPQINFHSIDIEKDNSYVTGNPSKQISVKCNNDVVEESIIRDTFLYIRGNKQSKDGMMYISDEVVQRIIEIGIRQCQYVSIGCWKNEKQLIKEILYYLKCRRIKYSDKDEQEWYIGEITDDVIELLLNRRKLPCGRLKWLEISFQNSVDDLSPIYSIFHYGREGFLKRLSKRDLYSMEKILTKYDLNYTIPQETEQIDT